ncbi:AbfB domain-containing protein [Streptomyces sp. NPDC006997]|uniref:AbfB domain-containing protein n=1 Tax=Streptomyces sp. NPDC006997 TaxID=3155356 RepID=UPI00340C80FC
MRPALGRRTVLGVITGSAAAALTRVPAGTAHPAVPASPGVTRTNTIAEQRAHTSSVVDALTWAPESHLTNGKWSIHFAAGDANDIWRIRPYVPQCTATNPVTGAWTEKGRIALPLDTSSPAATTFAVNGARCLCRAQHDPAVGRGTSLSIARMPSPWAVTGAPVILSRPTASWETAGAETVDEGPAVTQRGGKVLMTFSASATAADYRRDRFVRHWKYHARIEPSVSPLADSQCRVITGLVSSRTVSLKSAHFPGYFMHPRNCEARVEKYDVTSLFAGDASCTDPAGLSDAVGVSYESHGLPRRHLHHYDYPPHVQPLGTATNRADATFSTQ